MDRKRLITLVIIVVVLLAALYIFYNVTGNVVVKFNLQGSDLDLDKEYELSKNYFFRANNVLVNGDKVLISIEEMSEADEKVILKVDYEDYEKDFTYYPGIKKKIDLDSDGDADISLELVEIIKHDVIKIRVKNE